MLLEYAILISDSDSTSTNITVNLCKMQILRHRERGGGELRWISFEKHDFHLECIGFLYVT